MQTLILDKDPCGVATVLINRPAQRNAFDEQAMDEMLAMLHELDDDPDIRLLLISGAGRHFSAGVDVPWFKELISGDMEDLVEVTRKHVKLIRTLYEFPKPTIARVRGAAVGMSVGLVACCDAALCSEDAYFSFPEVRAGTVPGPAASYLVHAIGGRRAMRYFMSGERIPAYRAIEIGLVDEQYPDEESLDEAVSMLINEMLLGSPRAQTLCKRLVNNITGMQQRLDRLDAYSADTLAHMYLEAEAVDGARAFLSKKPGPWFRGRYGRG